MAESPTRVGNKMPFTAASVLHPASDPRDLGLAFGTFEVR